MLNCSSTTFYFISKYKNHLQTHKQHIRHLFNLTLKFPKTFISMEFASGKKGTLSVTSTEY